MVRNLVRIRQPVLVVGAAVAVCVGVFFGVRPTGRPQVAAICGNALEAVDRLVAQDWDTTNELRSSELLAEVSSSCGEDQVRDVESQLIGWREGAAGACQNALSRLDRVLLTDPPTPPSKALEQVVPQMNKVTEACRLASPRDVEVAAQKVSRWATGRLEAERSEARR